MFQLPEAIRNSIEATCLPSMPQILLRFLRLASDDRSTIADLAKLVGQDPALSARVIAVANSPALRRGSESKTIAQCLVNLGTRLSRTLAACLVVQKVFSSTVDNQQYDFTGFWGHSLRVAEVARAVAAEAGYRDIEEVYLSGLMHDIGQLLLLGGVEERYGTLLVLSRDEADLRDIEEQRLGTDHAVIGAWLVEQWNLSSFMADAILFHHNSVEEIATADTLSRIIWSAHAICCYCNRPDPAQKSQMPGLDAINRMLGVTLDNVLKIYTECSERVGIMASALGITETADAKTLPYASSTPLKNFRPIPGVYATAYSEMEEVVRDLAMMQPLQQNLAALGSEAEILTAVRESAGILFDAGPFAFLLIHQERNMLSGAVVDDQPTMLQRIEIPLDARHCLAAAVVLEREARSTFGNEDNGVVALADLQVARILGSQGLVYIPMRASRQDIGVMVCGVTAEQAGRLQKRFKWMTSFASMAALSVESWRDMRDREKKAEAAMAKRFEEQARMVIHEAGNPLSIIKNYLEIVRLKQPDGEKLMPEFDILSEEIDRVTSIMRRMTSAAESIKPDAAGVDVNNLVDSLLTLYGESLFTSRGITVEKRLDPAIGSIPSDRDSVKQILFNLWNNAADAMSDGGNLHISTSSEVNQNGRSYIEIRLIDTGPGLPQDVINRLFQPLEPDRRHGHSGIGLSIVAELVARLDGSITCQSKAGHGTSFSILLPVSRRNEA